MSMHSQFAGFTLAELLISLAILGVIATFTIPKVLNSQQSGEYNATAKETAAMISGAFENYRYTTGVTGSSDVNDLTPFMNYVAVDTGSLMDDWPLSGTSLDCSGAGRYCLRLHNGGLLHVRSWTNFVGTEATNAIFYTFDPDGKVSSAKGINLYVYANGAITSEENARPNTVTGDGTKNPASNGDPDWFSW